MSEEGYHEPVCTGISSGEDMRVLGVTEEDNWPWTRRSADGVKRPSKKLLYGIFLSRSWAVCKKLLEEVGECISVKWGFLARPSPPGTFESPTNDPIGESQQVGSYRKTGVCCVVTVPTLKETLSFSSHPCVFCSDPGEAGSSGRGRRAEEMEEGLIVPPFHALGLPIREIRKTQVQFVGQEGPLEEEMEVHSSIFAWKVPQRSLVGYSPWGRRVGRDLATEQEEGCSHYVSGWGGAPGVVIGDSGLCMWLMF